MKATQSALLAASVAALSATAASAQVTVISDNFETDSSADYTIVNTGTPDGQQDFQFDYVAAGIPLAPRSTAGDTKAVKITVNESMSLSDAFTVCHNTLISADQYTVEVDVWMNFAGSSGTTEFATVGVGGDATTFNQAFSPISGSGAYISFDGDGDSSSDYRWFRDAANTPVGETDSTTLPNSHPSYLGNGSNNTGAFFQNLFPNPPSTIAGSPGNIWTTVTVDVDNVAGVISFSFDNSQIAIGKTLTFQGDFANRFDGAVSFGLADIFTSVGTIDQFSLFDNFTVTTPTNFVGTNYCTAVANSTGVTGSIAAAGSDVVANNDITLEATNLPTNSFGFFVTSMNQGFVQMPGGSTGNLCLSGMIGRYVGAGQIQNSGAAGAFSLTLDLGMVPQPQGFVSVAAGDTWNFQGWFRDSIGGSATSNFTQGVEITFQ